MKKALGGLLVVCIVIVTLLIVIDFGPHFAGKKNSPDEPRTHQIEINPVHIVDGDDPLNPLVKANPAADSAVMAEATTDESAKPTVVTEPSAATKIEAEPTPADKTPPSPPATVLPVPAESQPRPTTTQYPSEGSGLLTDTAETAENQLMEPQSTQVAAAFPKLARKTGRAPAAARPAKETINLEIATTPQGTYPFSILLETLNEQETAQQAIALYRNKGLAAYWVKANLGAAGVKYRLFTGMFPTETAAQTFRNMQHLTGKPIKNTAYAAQIGVFRDTKELAVAFVKTSETGVFPYILGTENGPFFLYVGAFYTTAGAESQCRELLGIGFPCKVVTRSTLPSN